jgi:hypothetical protein
VPSALVTWLATLFLFVISILGGFTIGRYSSLLPLLLAAFAVTKELGTPLRTLALGSAVLTWWLFSFLLFGRVYLLTSLLIEAAFCFAALLLHALFSPRHLL